MATSSIKARPHAVFVGCPWKTIRAKYERIFEKKTFKRRHPLLFIIVGRDGNQKAEDLFTEIKRQIDSSSCAIFDVSGGNANVSLEFGYAQGIDVAGFVFVNEHQKFKHDRGANSAIISDLSGVRRNSYKNETGLERLLKQFTDQHEYTQRVLTVSSKHRLSAAEKGVLMSLPRAFRDFTRLRRAALRQFIIAETKSSDEVVEKIIDIARRNRLIRVSVGQHGYTTLRP